MTTQLVVFNRALAALGERSLASLVEPREPQRVLSSLWADCVQFCLEGGVWNFAMRNGQAIHAGAGDLNYSDVFTKPADFVRLFTASVSASYAPPLVNDFIDQGGQLFANSTVLYIRYVSNDASAGGGNLALWTQTFATYVTYTLAAWAALRITGSVDVAGEMTRLAQAYHLRALAIDSVAALPGLRPFNAEARGLPVEAHQGLPIDMAPFLAPFAGPPPQRGNDGGGAR